MTCANWEGFVYEHILVAEKYLGRSLRPDEVVHHLDRDRSNNRHENLLVLPNSQHIKLHLWLGKGALASKESSEQGMNSRKPKEKSKLFCANCGLTLQDKQKKCCSVACLSELRYASSPRPTKRQLEKDLKNLSKEAIGRKYGVSGNAVSKWQKSFLR